MGSHQLEERWEQERDETAAKFIGLTLSEYQSLDPEITQDESATGMHTGFIVTFRQPIPEHLRVKITGLEVDIVRLSQWAFDQDDSDEQGQ
jgi:hypothetical protein